MQSLFLISGFNEERAEEALLHLEIDKSRTRGFREKGDRDLPSPEILAEKSRCVLSLLNLRKGGSKGVRGRKR